MRITRVKGKEPIQIKIEVRAIKKGSEKPYTFRSIVNFEKFFTAVNCLKEKALVAIDMVVKEELWFDNNIKCIMFCTEKRFFYVILYFHTHDNKIYESKSIKKVQIDTVLKNLKKIAGRG